MASQNVLQRPLPERLRVALDMVGVVLLALFLVAFAERSVTHQGDLRTYRLAARVALDGGDPYQPGVLSSLAGHDVFPFVYPPVTLVPFLATANLEPRVVAAVWIWAKIALLGLLVLAWTTWFLRGAPLITVALLATFGWNSSAQWDLSTGNVAMVECGLVWAAFLCFVSGRPTWFALLIVAAACFKLAPAAFLLILLVPTEGAAPSLRRLAVSLGLLTLLVLGPLVAGPASRFQHFWAHIPDATTDGAANPSALGLATMLAYRVGFSGALAGQVATGAFVAYVLGLLGCSAPLLAHAWRSRDARRWTMTAVFLYVLLLPRPMAYGFVMLIPAPLFFAPKPFDRPAGRLLLALMLAAQGMWRLTRVGSDSPFVTYAPFLLSLCVWLLVLKDHAAAPKSAVAAPLAGRHVERTVVRDDPDRGAARAQLGGDVAAG